jgi:CheY-like chemotaxis protein
VKPLRVLVAEDDAIIGIFLAELITGMGYEICTVVDSEADAVLAAAQYRPDLMVFDARLGEGSGIAAVAEILRSDSIPYLFITGEKPSDLDLAADVIVLQKPFQEVDLAHAMLRALNMKRETASMETGNELFL